MADLSLGEFSKRYIAIISEVMKRAMRSQTDELAKGKITIPQFLVLHIVSKSGAQKMSFLAKEMGVSLPAMSGLINRLHKLGMVKRIYDQADRRIIRVSLTEKGKNLVKQVILQRQRMISNIFSTVRPQEREEFLRILSKIHNLYKH
jgi:DNA-binding MarR family transcriptional regulator